MSKLASVIIFSYNRLHFLKDALDSVLRQSYGSIELVIADDASTDFDGHMDTYLSMPLEAYIQKYNGGNVKKIMIIKNKKNMGTVRNLKNATDKCTGEYIFSCGADDLFYHDDVVKTAVELMEKNGYDALMGQFAILSNDLTRFIRYGWPEYFIDLFRRNRRAELLRHVLSGHGFGMMVFTKPIYNELDFYNTPLFLMEDYYRNIAILKSKAKIGCFETPLLKYRLSDGSVLRCGDVNTNRLVSMELLLTRKMLLQEQLNELKNTWLKLINSNRKIIVWGASVGFDSIFEDLIGAFHTISYIVDNDSKKHGLKQNGINIYPVEILLSENKDEILVLVCSSYYYESILPWLMDNGFEEGVNATLVNEILLLSLLL